MRMDRVQMVRTCWGADALRVDENQCKEKEKKTYLVGCERVDALACGDGLDADDCEDKKKEKKRKTY